MLEKFRVIAKQKGQGVIEYAVLLAFVVALAMFLNAGGLKGSVIAVFDDVEDFLAYRTYLEYYGDWHNLSYSDLSAQSNEKRIRADQEGLQKLVQNLIGLDQGLALAELKKIMGNNAVTANDVNPNGQDGNGDSKVLTLLGTWDHYIDNHPQGDSPYVTLSRETQANAVAYVTNGQASTYKLSNGKTVSGDRVFYSNDMIKDNQEKTVTAQLHYKDGKVESVDVVTHIGNASSKNYAESLSITVTGSGRKDYTVK